ncbi:metal-dependent hydrolase [Achromobacter aloeverae]|uniref:Metal-dependent hydrolase n=1 Tax=Achromobacter aloeverae TaxID=1750518 RepID=A0A4Q1HDW7_9BURK|nr:metal-dependent hydrolase [Achromobacter aloeverae]
MRPRHLLYVLLALLAIAPALLPTRYVLLLDYVGVAALVALGVVLLTGIGGLLNLAQAGFAGVGAYVTALFTTQTDALPGGLAWLGGSPWLALAAGLLLTLALAALLGALTVRLPGPYLALCSIAWGLALPYAFGVLGGHGIDGIAPIRVAGVALDTADRMYYLIWPVLLVVLWAQRNLLDSRQGRAMRALRGGCAMAESMGVNSARLRFAILLIAAAQACIAGWLYAHLQRHVDPGPFSLRMGIEYVFMALVGGAAHVWGALLGAGLFTATGQWLRDTLVRLQWPFAGDGAYGDLGRYGGLDIALFGLVALVVLSRARDGLWPILARRLPLDREDGKVNMAAEPLPKRPLPPRGDIILEALRVTRRFGDRPANHEVSLSAEAGSILALIGPNGAGKSTLLDLLSGVDTPSSGAIVFMGDAVTGRGPRHYAELGLCRSFQQACLLPERSVLDNTALGAHLRGTHGIAACAGHADRREEARLLAEATRQLERVGLGDCLHQPAASLPPGRRRLLEIARALAADPCLLLLDEPAAGLRATEKTELAALLHKLRAGGMTILLAEHDRDFVMELADQVLVMDAGAITVRGTPAEVRAHPALRAAYVGSVR